MRSSYKIASQLLAVVLTFALMQVCVLAIPASPSGTPLFGRLSSNGTQKVMVNGNEVLSGTTVLSGSQIQTPSTTGATITLASAGKLDIAPKTNLMVTFDKTGASVQVLSGDALLTTSQGVKGSLTGPDGKAKATDGLNVSSIGTAMYQDGSKDQDKNGGQGGGNSCFIAGIPCALFWVMVGGGSAVAAYFAATRGNNSSPSAP